MADNPTADIWRHQALFLLLTLGIVFLSLVPLNTVPRNIAPPDLLLALTFAWVARRPDFLPVWLIALLFFLTDFLFHRPPGLWAALVVLGTEFLRNRIHNLRNMTFVAEWAMVGTVLLAIMVGNRLVLALTATPQVPLSLTLIQIGATILIYPLAVLASNALFGVRKTAPGEVDALGHRL